MKRCITFASNVTYIYRTFPARRATKNEAGRINNIIMKKEIIIGRSGNQPFEITDPKVSRVHAKLVIREDGTMRLTDENSPNGTFVRMKNGEFKRITELDPVTKTMTVRLGPKLTYKVGELIPEDKTDITQLKYLEEYYESNRIKYENSINKINSMRTFTLIGGTAAAGIFGSFAAIFGEGKNVSDTVKILSAVIPLLVGVLFFFILTRKYTKVSNKRSINEKNFKNKFCCPKCGYPLNGKTYNNWLAIGKCPNSNCGTKFHGEY